MDGKSGELTGWEDVVGAWTGRTETEGLEWGGRRELGSWFQRQGDVFIDLCSCICFACCRFDNHRHENVFFHILLLRRCIGRLSSCWGLAIYATFNVSNDFFILSTFLVFKKLVLSKYHADFEIFNRTTFRKNNEIIFVFSFLYEPINRLMKMTTDISINYFQSFTYFLAGGNHVNNKWCSVKPLLTYGDFSIYQNGGRSPSWIFMAALCNRGPLYFCPVISIYLLSFLFLLFLA